MNTLICSTPSLRSLALFATLLFHTAARASLAQFTISATAAQTSLQFNPAEVGAPASSAQVLTASFTVSNYGAGPYAPTAQLHYGIAFSASAVTCTGTASPETCTVSVTFHPNFPGGRKDALVLMNGATPLATVFVYGIGEAPQALLQPGVVTHPVSSANNGGALFQSAVGEDGTVFISSDNSDPPYVLEVDTDGGVSQLPITFPSKPQYLAIDGAGTVYIALNGGESIITYSASGMQGSVALAPPDYCPQHDPVYIYAVATDGLGDIFGVETYCNSVIELQADGGYVVTPTDPAILQPSSIALDSVGNIFVGGNSINEAQLDGGQSQISARPASFSLSVDPAETVYETDGATGSLSELAAADYTQVLASLSPGSSTVGASLGPDGTVYVGDQTSLDKIDRSQCAIDFGQLYVTGNTLMHQVSLYNGGNQTLHVSSLQLTGTGFALVPASTTCAAGSLAPGALCQIEVAFTALNAGAFSGTVAIASDSLNSSSAVTQIPLAASVVGIEVVATPSPLAFPAQAINTTSAPIAVTLTNNGYSDAASLSNYTSSNAAFAVEIGTCSSPVAPGQSCALSVTFSPTAAQAYSGTITIAEAGNDNTQTIAIAVSGTGAAVVPLAPVVSLPPAVAFPDTTVGTTSQVQSIVATNLGNAPLTISNIALSGSAAFVRKSVSSDCGTTLAVNAACTISIAFAPTSVGPFTGTVTVTDDAADSPQSIALSGNGISAGVPLTDFSISATPGIEGIGAGAIATFAVTVAANTGAFNDAVALSVSGLPTGASATFAPASVTPGATSAMSTLSVQTHAGEASARKPGSPKSDPFGPWLAALCFPPLIGFGKLRRALSKLQVRGGLLVLMILSQGFLGCGTKALKSYSLTITGTSGGIQRSTVVTLTVE